jgi:hypothetical protein
MDRNLLFQPRLLDIPSEPYLKKVSAGNLSSSNPSSYRTPAKNPYSKEPSSNKTERHEHKEELVNEIIDEITLNLKRKGIEDQRILKVVRDAKRKNREIEIGSKLDALLEMSSQLAQKYTGETCPANTRAKSASNSTSQSKVLQASLMSEPGLLNSPQYLAPDTRRTISSPKAVNETRRTISSPKTMGNETKRNGFSPTTGAETRRVASYRAAELPLKVDLTSSKASNVDTLNLKRKEILRKRERELLQRESELRRKEATFEEQKDSYERSITQRLQEIQKADNDLKTQRKEFYMDQKRLLEIKTELDQKAQVLKNQETLRGSYLYRNNLADERLVMVKEDLASHAARIEEYERWLVMKEKELNEVNHMLIDERADLEKTECFFEQLDMEMQEKSSLIQNQTEKLEVSWKELEVERQRLYKWSLQLKSLSQEIKCKEHKLEATKSALIERRKALKQYQKALELRESTIESNFSAYSKSSRLSNYVSSSKVDLSPPDLEELQIELEGIESDLTGDLISVLTPRTESSAYM